MTATLTKTSKTQRGHSAERQVLMDYVTQIAPMSEAEMDAIFEMLNIRTHKKGTVLVREGQFAQICYFVLRGCVRQYYLIDGEEKTTHFYTEGQPVSSTFVFDDKPSKFFLVCNETCTLIEGRPEDEQIFFEKMPRMEAVSRIGAEVELQKSHEILADYITSSPEERYLRLLETRPDLIDRVPQYQLASYLGIKPESLSRVRRRILTKARSNE